MTQQNHALAVVHSRGSDGIHAPPVRVEVHFGGGLPGMTLVGTSSTVGVHARERVRAALTASSFELPLRKITVNLAPAELPKNGGRFDLPIAVGILAADRLLPMESLRNRELFGELALTGALHASRGILPAVMACLQTGREAIVAAADAAVLHGVSGPVRCARTLSEVVAYLRGRISLPTPSELLQDAVAPPRVAACGDFLDVVGQRGAKRMLEIAAAGGHHALLLGPPGCGKTMLAQRMPSILPPLRARDAMQVRAIASVANIPMPSADAPPIRMPHHSTGQGALLGGGSQLWPGEITMAHHGVLLMDELAEWPREILDTLRQPLQDGEITLARGRRTVTYPAQFQLIAASNLCPCGNQGNCGKPKCRCKAGDIERYLKRLSGPFLDRLDLQMRLNVVRPMLGLEPSAEESSTAIRARVIAARERAIHRSGCINAALSVPQLEAACQLPTTLRRRFESDCDAQGITMRGIHKALRVARTIADLGNAPEIQAEHLSMALAFRPQVLQIS